MFPLSTQGGHSSRVKMRLLIGAHSIPVAQLGPDFVLVEAAADHPPADARVVLQVDQSERTWDISLPHGISASSERVAIAARA